MAKMASEPEKVAVIRKIRRLMAFWGITTDELQGVKVRQRRVAEPVPTVRYVHPVSGETWNGIGKQPDWLRVALISEGYTVDQLRTPSDHAERIPLKSSPC